jgi:regulator of RNase E activity RraA
MHALYDAYELLWGSINSFLHAHILLGRSSTITCMYGDPHMQVLKRAKENNILVGK